jgi:hypothetical protein
VKSSAEKGDFDSMPMKRQPALRVESDPSRLVPRSVIACGLGPGLVGFLSSSAQPRDLLKSIFRVRVDQTTSPAGDTLPDVSGRYFLCEDEAQFIPHFPFERDVKYRATFDLRPLGLPLAADPLRLDFLVPAEPNIAAITAVTNIFPSCDLLPENLLRFYVCFSNTMQRGRALEEISLLDSDGHAVADALYRPPCELWDKTMRRLTVLLDPGRLKRWVGPNAELGPPLKAGQEYTLEIGPGMTDLYGRPLRERFRKPFFVSGAVREAVSVEHWKIFPPAMGSRQALVVTFPKPLDWAPLMQAIAIESSDRAVIDGRVDVDQCETRWTFTPKSPWTAGVYHMRVASSLEDVCGNSITGPFDRPLRKDPSLVSKPNASLSFELT